MEDMPRHPYRHTTRITTRHGKTLWYFRVDKGPRTPLPLPFASPEFIAAYEKALAAHLNRPAPLPTNSLGWLIEQYLVSVPWLALAAETRKQYKLQYAKLKTNTGTARLADINKAAIIEGRDRRAATPSDANKFVKSTRKLFAFALDRGWVKSNPCDGVELVKLPNRATGFHAWTEDEAAAFEQRWPIGTKQRLAFDLLIYTGVRRGDVVRLGRQHLKGGTITLVTQKSFNSGHPVTVAVRLLPPLARSIAAAPTGDMTFLVTAYKRPFSKWGFGSWFKEACVAAGVQGSSHGIRKIAAIRMAENGATESELNATFGWADGSRESATYTRAANRAKLSQGASSKLIPKPTGFSPKPKTEGKLS